jgi:hypothetical protein
MNNDDINTPQNQNSNNGSVPVNTPAQNTPETPYPRQQAPINDFMARSPRPMIPKNPNFENSRTQEQNIAENVNDIDLGSMSGMPQPTVSVHKKSSKRLITVLVALVILVLLAAGGYFLVKSMGSKKTVSTTPVTTSMANMTNTWTGKGTSDNFSDTANWSMGVPVNGQMLEINLANLTAPATASTTAGSSSTVVVASPIPTINNDMPALSVKELKIDGNAKISAFNLTGKALGLTGDINVNPTSSTTGLKVGINLPVTLGADSLLSVGGTNVLTISGDTTSVFALGSHILNVSVSNTSNLNFDMPLSGTGSLMFATNSVGLAANAYFQTASTAFSGSVEIGNNDVVVLGNSGTTSAFGQAAITVDNGGSLELQSTTNTYALANALNLSGSGVKNSSTSALGATTGALTGCVPVGPGKCNGGLAVTLSGMTTLNAATEVGALYLPQAGAKLTGSSVSYHFANLMKNNFNVTAVANSQAVIN